MERMNEVRVIGNVGMVNASEKHTYIAVALNESYKAKGADEWTDKTVWVDVVIFGPNREKVTKQGIAKGDGILVIGKLDSSEYEGKRKTQIVANKVQLIQKRTPSNGEGTGDTIGTNASINKEDVPTEQPAAAPVAENATSDDDLPF